MQTPYIETDCTIEHEGRKFTSGGAVVTEDYVVAYVGQTIDHVLGNPPYTGMFSRRNLTDWHGNVIGTCSFTASWRISSWQSDRMYQIWATVNGVRYTGRGMGAGMVCRLRRAK
jgi:hypothetical protein